MRPASLSHSRGRDVTAPLAKQIAKPIIVAPYPSICKLLPKYQDSDVPLSFFSVEDIKGFKAMLSSSCTASFTSADKGYP